VFGVEQGVGNSSELHRDVTGILSSHLIRSVVESALRAPGRGFES
jgi:hypothetical protein